jgi:hypothetical protein
MQDFSSETCWKDGTLYQCHQKYGRIEVTSTNVTIIPDGVVAIRFRANCVS